MKVCNKCGKRKKLSKFYDATTKDGKRGNCKKCQRRISRENERRRHEDRSVARAKSEAWLVGHAARMEADEAYRNKRRDMHYQKQYGITLADFFVMEEAQQGGCAICGYVPDPEDTRPRWRLLEVDHCHDTSQVRGLLCRRCNDALGKFEDSQELLVRALTYLQTF